MKIVQVDSRELDYPLAFDKLAAWFDKWANENGYFNTGWLGAESGYRLPPSVTLKYTSRTKPRYSYYRGTDRYGFEVWKKRKVGTTVNLRSRYTSGCAYGSWHILLRCGTDFEDFVHCALHELCHTATVGQGHGAGFYACFFKAATDYGMDMKAWYNRERGYKPRGVKQAMAALRVGIAQ